MRIYNNQIQRYQIFLKKMRQQKILIKDPYLNSTFKSETMRSPYLSVPKPTFQTGFHHAQVHQTNDNSKWGIQADMRRQLQNTRNQFRRMTRAYTEQNNLNKKILDYQVVNNQYHEGLKLRNLDLNNKIIDLASQNHLLSNRFEGDIARNYHQKDLLLRKYQAQAQQLLQAKKTINNLIQHKTKLQQQLQHLTFLLQNQSQRFSLQMQEQGIRMQALQRSIKNVSETKDQQINQLRHKLRVYQDQNKRLCDQNRSLHLINETQKQNRAGIQNLSQIHHLDSQSKQNANFNKHLQDQKQMNQQLRRQVDELKKKLFNQKRQQIPNINDINNQTQKHNFKKQKNEHQKIRQMSPNKNEIDKVEGIINSINTLRGGITREVFQVFYKSVKDGQKHRSNSLVIFIQNWKNIDMQRITPYIQSYLESRESLKQICLSDKYAGKPINQRMQNCIPLRIALKKGRNQINVWILSTIQLTKNQRQSSKKSMNNLLLFLFRLLTIQYRITYPMQGKSYTIDQDVRNQLSHQIVKAIDYIIQYQ